MIDLRKPLNLLLAIVALPQAGCIAVFGVRESDIRSDGPRQTFVVDGDSDGSDDAAPIRRLLKSLARADSSGDAEAAARLYTQDAEWLPPDRSAVFGREAIRESYERLFEGRDIGVEINADEIEISGDMAYARGTTRITPRGDSAAAPTADDFLMVLQRDSDGLWKIDCLMWHPAAASQ
jgi:uncharacterized protein (TIGR02246 family)